MVYDKNGSVGDDFNNVFVRDLLIYHVLMILKNTKSGALPETKCLLYNTNNNKRVS